MHIENVHIHIEGSLARSLIAGATGLSMAGVSNGVGEVDPEPYASAFAKLVPPRVGEWWDGQGGIYAGLVGGREGAPDYHLVLATYAGAIFEKRAIGTYGTDVQGACSDHDGLANTTAYAAAGSDLCKEIMALSIDGHSDFYLPSRIESRLLWCNLPDHFEKEWYLTSTQYSASNAWTQDFDNGSQYHYDKKFEARARAVRRLIL